MNNFDLAERAIFQHPEYTRILLPLAVEGLMFLKDVFDKLWYIPGNSGLSGRMQAWKNAQDFFGEERDFTKENSCDFIKNNVARLEYNIEYVREECSRVIAGIIREYPDNAEKINGRLRGEYKAILHNILFQKNREFNPEGTVMFWKKFTSQDIPSVPFGFPIQSVNLIHGSQGKLQ